MRWYRGAQAVPEGRAREVRDFVQGQLDTIDDVDVEVDWARAGGPSEGSFDPISGYAEPPSGAEVEVRSATMTIPEQERYLDLSDFGGLGFESSEAMWQAVSAALPMTVRTCRDQYLEDGIEIDVCFDVTIYKLAPLDSANRAAFGEHDYHVRLADWSYR